MDSTFLNQFFETVNFAFMKIFDFLVKIAIFEAFLHFLGDLRHALRVKNLWIPGLEGF